MRAKQLVDLGLDRLAAHPAGEAHGGHEVLVLGHRQAPKLAQSHTLCAWVWVHVGSETSHSESPPTKVP